MKIFINIIMFLAVTVGLHSCKNADVKSPTITAATQNDKPADYYKEQHRNQFHFSPEVNWMNDPNGMVYLDGEYHLFYQYYPDSTVWGPMHWAHAVSSDMIHWKHLPIALYPDTLGYIFSGSAVIDKNNTAGFGKDAMVAMFTYHDIHGERSGSSITFQYQGIAYSTDKGRTFTKYEGNPVIPNPGIKDFRDPKIIWDEANSQWVMVLAAYDKAMFYTSKDLKAWELASEFGIVGDTRLWECPDLFPIKVKGSEETKWVLITSIQKEAPNGGTATGYFVGDWDGKQFIGNTKNQKWLDYGTDNYAAVTWADAPNPTDEKSLIGWMSNWQYAQVVPTEKWRSAMTLPRTITLHKENGEYHLRSLPVVQSSKIEKTKYGIQPKKITESTVLSKEGIIPLQKLDLSLVPASDAVVSIRLSNAKEEYTVVGYNAVSKNYFIDRTHSGKVDFQKDFADKIHYAPVDYNTPSINMTIFIDHAAIELFADYGRTAMTDIVFPTEPYDKVEINSSGGGVKILNGSLTELGNIWR